MLALKLFWLIESSGGIIFVVTIELLLQANDSSGSILIKLLFRSKLDIDVVNLLFIDALLFDVAVADSKDDISFLQDNFDDDLSESSDS